MSKKFKVWLDSGANHQSCRKATISLDEIGLTDAEWDGMNEERRDAAMREVAFEQSDWGYAELEEGEDEE
jgi:hypothetical protein